MERQSSVRCEGLRFPEGPRWHEGRLVFSDMHDERVLAMDHDGRVETVVEVPRRPSGLGWDPQGRMLVVSMIDRRLLRMEPATGELGVLADLGAFATGHCNDMVVDAEGRAYVGNFGFDIDTPPLLPVTTCIVRVDPDGSVSVAADEIRFPNGTVITPDGRTLVVGESFGGCLTAFDVAPDGSLSERRIWAQLDGAVPDGICLDAEGAIWSACPISGRVLRVREGGEVTDVVHVERNGAFACMLGGPDRTTLHVCTADSSNPADTDTRRGAIETCEVTVPGAGLP
ncbi:MAG: SMP-30/gluconolactonase/LRE family protein [Actinobacteria bacterium]|nr:SMP-30/gluconolactonase/LRE family protein [Actinomycetota bacterium]